MSALRRAFLAAVPPPSVLDSIEVLVEDASRSGFRWARRDQWHVTVQYFGRVADVDALVGALAGGVAAVPAARMLLQGAGGFPSARRASVYWLGVADPEPIGAVHSAVMEAAGGFVRSRDVVRYRPHLTLARMSSPKNVTPEVEALAGVTIGAAFVVEEIVLMESETRRTGAVYHPIARLPLA